jgi:hypothetical protein
LHNRHNTPSKNDSPPKSILGYRNNNKSAGIGTSRQIWELPPFSHDAPKYISSKLSFLLSRTLIIFRYFALLTILSIIENEAYYPYLQEGDYNPDKEYLFRRLFDVKKRELLIRLYLPILAFATQYATLSLYDALLSLIAVAAGGDQPGHWPPLFGDIRDAYSLRKSWRFVANISFPPWSSLSISLRLYLPRCTSTDRMRLYSMFWNSTLRTSFVSHASLITYSTLRMPRGTHVARLTVTALVFLISALMHAIPLKLLGGACAAFPVIHWYFLVAVGITVEDLVVGTVKYLGLDDGRVGSGEERCWTRLGYVWFWGGLLGVYRR